MTRAACTRQWEAEAARDGRLDVASALDFRAHASRCDSCAAELDALAAMATRLRNAPAVSPDRLARVRQRVLVQATRRPAAWPSGQASPSLRWPRPLVLGAALAGLLVLGLWLAGTFEGGGAEGTVGIASQPNDTNRVGSPLVRPELTFTATADGSAQWHENRADDEQRVVLLDGRLALVVQRPVGAPRLVVQVPDGEIEDIGTTFHVAVAGGRTVEVAVASGRVILRLRGEVVRELGPGEVWRRVESAQVPAGVERVEAGSTLPVAPEAGDARETLAKASPPTTSPTTRATATTRPKSPPNAVDSVSVPPLETVTPPGSDAALEDAAYLDVLALVRAGRVEAARAAAQDYLRRFPDGFRRAEVGEVAR